MKKLGILTFHRATNFGAVLQAFAMKRVCEGLGYEAHVVDYRKKPDLGPRPIRSFLRSRRNGKALIRLAKGLLSYYWNKKRWKAFRDFRRKYLEETEQCPDGAAVSALGFDRYVMGSDQIWNYRITGGEYDPVFFGILPGEACCTVYGASAHDTPFPLDMEMKLQELLESSKAAIGIREKKLADYVASLTGVRYPVVLDPTLLAGKDLMEEVESDARPKQPYILLYQIDANPASDISISSLERRFGCRTYSMTVPKLGSTHGKKGGLGPGDFLALLDHAEFVVTNSFHGVALSLLWHKQFFVYENGGVMTRIDGLLNALDLTDRKLSSVSEIDLTRQIDYDRVDPILEKLREESLCFLRNALEGKQYRPVAASEPAQTFPTPFSERSREDCSGCSACVEICPAGAIRMKRDREGFLYPAVDGDACIHCGKCDSFCSFQTPPRRSREELPRAFGVKHRNGQTRMASRSGGAFVAVSDRVLEQNGVVYGAALESDGVVRHIRAHTKEERNRMQGAKYVQSDLTGILPQVLQDLREGLPVLFSGTPCQVAGVYSLLRSENVSGEKLLTCDLVCHGAPSPMIWSDYLSYIREKYRSPIVKADFRDKSFGWASHCESFLLENGKKLVSRDYTDLFYEHLMFRPSCYHCRFANVNRPGDLSLADFWGVEKSDPAFEDSRGVSLVLVNSPKGEAAFEAARGDLECIPCRLENCLQPSLVKPSAASPRRAQFWKSYEAKGFAAAMKEFVKPLDPAKRIKRALKQWMFQIGLRKHP